MKIVEELDRAAEIHKEALADLADAGIVLWGTPGRYGSMSASVKYSIVSIAGGTR